MGPISKIYLILVLISIGNPPSSLLCFVVLDQPTEPPILAMVPATPQIIPPPPPLPPPLPIDSIKNPSSIKIKTRDGGNLNHVDVLVKQGRNPMMDQLEKVLIKRKNRASLIVKMQNLEKR